MHPHPLPWKASADRYSGGVFIDDGRGYHIVCLNGITDGYSKEIESRELVSFAERLVKAVNTQAAMLEACIQARLCINHHGIVGDPASGMLDEAIEKASG